MSLLDDLASYLTAPWRKLDGLHADLVRHELAIIQLRRDLMATAQDLASRIDAATNEVAEDLKTVRDELSAVREGANAQVQAAVDSALATIEGSVSRLEQLGADPSDPVPAPVETGPVDDATPAS